MTIIISERQLKVIQESVISGECLSQLGISINDIINNIKMSGVFDGLFPHSEDDTENGDGIYPFENEKQMKEKIISICRFFANFEDPFPVWRSIRIDKLEDIKRDELLGNSWSFVQKSAVHFASSIWGNNGNTILKANCPFSAVDWVETISRYIQDNTDGSNFNNSFSENEIYVEYPGRLYDVDVERTTLTESYDNVRSLILEATGIIPMSYDTTEAGKSYVFEESDAAINDIKKNWKYTSHHRFEPGVEGIFDKNDKLFAYCQKSKKEGLGKRKFNSDYYQTVPNGSTKIAARISDHWSFYVIPDYYIRKFKKMVTLVIVGTGCPIGNKGLYYILKLPTGTNININFGLIEDAYNSSTKRYEDGGKLYLLLDSWVAKKIDIINGKETNFGSIYGLDCNDYNIIKKFNDWDFR